MYGKSRYMPLAKCESSDVIHLEFLIPLLKEKELFNLTVIQVYS